MKNAWAKFVAWWKAAAIPFLGVWWNDIGDKPASHAFTAIAGMVLLQTLKAAIHFAR